MISYIRPFYEHGLDAVIVQDLGVMWLIKKHFPDMDIHAEHTDDTDRQILVLSFWMGYGSSVLSLQER